MKKIISKLIGFYLNGLALVAPRLAARQAFELFCFPFRRKIKQKHKDFLLSGHPVEMQLDDHSFTLYQWGSGPRKILFLHGWQSHTFRWKAYIEDLNNEQFSVYSIDAPGHGLSSGSFMTVPLYSEAIAHAISHIGEIDSVVSHSIGGFTALYTFHTKPHLAPQKLITLAPPGEAKDFFSFYNQQLGLSKKCLALTIDHFKKEIGQSPEYFSAKTFASTLNMPGLLIHDEEDDETSVEHSKIIHRSWANSKLIVTKGKGHNLKSRDVVKTVVDFINEDNEKYSRLSSSVNGNVLTY